MYVCSRIPCTTRIAVDFDLFLGDAGDRVCEGMLQLPLSSWLVSWSISMQKWTNVSRLLVAPVKSVQNWRDGAFFLTLAAFCSLLVLSVLSHTHFEMADAEKKQAIAFAKTCYADLGGAGILPSLRQAPGDLFVDFPDMRTDTDKKDFLRGILGQVPTTGLCVFPVPLTHE